MAENNTVNKSAAAKPEDAPEKPKRGGRNLMLLGLISIAISIATTAISVAIYHYSGDIYLDRSRPGFLPEESENDTPETKFTFSDDGTVDEKVLDEYLKHLEEEQQKLNTTKPPFSPDPLSDESLGIPAQPASE